MKKLVGENTRFIYGVGGELIGEFDSSSGSMKKEYVYGGGTVATIEPTAVNSNGTRYSTRDHLGSPRVITNSTAGVVSRHDYKPFGEELSSGIGGRTTGMGFGIADGNRKKFTGYERDNETGLDFAQARYYSNTFGRFTSPDPFSGSMSATDPQSFNRYAYVGNNPVNRSDPSGLDWNSNATHAAASTRYGAHIGSGWSILNGKGQTHRDFQGSIEPQYPEPEAEAEADDGVTIIGYVFGPAGLLIMGIPQNPAPYTKDETDSLRDALDKTLQGNCKKFVDAFRNRISTSSNSARSSLDVFDDVRRQQGFFHVYTSLGWALGSIKEGDARIGLSTSFNTSDRVLVLIHELLHHGGTSSGFDHTTMGTAAWEVGREQGLLDGLKNTNTPGPPREGRDDVSTNYNATLFDNILKAACGPK